MKSVSESQFTEAVYRNYHGEPLTSIAKDFGIGQSTLSQFKARRADDWERIHQQIVATEIVRLVFANTPRYFLSRGRSPNKLDIT